jgi:hypothetical protein
MWILLRREGVRRANLPGGIKACARGREAMLRDRTEPLSPPSWGPCTGEGARRGSVSAACHAE